MRYYCVVAEGKRPMMKERTHVEDALADLVSMKSAVLYLARSWKDLVAAYPKLAKVDSDAQ